MFSPGSSGLLLRPSVPLAVSFGLISMWTLHRAGRTFGWLSSLPTFRKLITWETVREKLSVSTPRGRSRKKGYSVLPILTIEFI